MATAIRIEALPARLGDCLLVECLRPGGAPWRMLVDGGPVDTWPLLEARLATAGLARPDRRRRGHPRRQRPHRRLHPVRAERVRARARRATSGSTAISTWATAQKSIEQGESVGVCADRGRGGGPRAALEQGLRRGRDRDADEGARRGHRPPRRPAHHRALAGPRAAGSAGPQWSAALQQGPLGDHARSADPIGPKRWATSRPSPRSAAPTTTRYPTAAASACWWSTAEPA